MLSESSCHTVTLPCLIHGDRIDVGAVGSRIHIVSDGLNVDETYRYVLPVDRNKRIHDGLNKAETALLTNHPQVDEVTILCGAYGK
jgi:hypothetical protein